MIGFITYGTARPAVHRPATMTSTIGRCWAMVALATLIGAGWLAAEDNIDNCYLPVVCGDLPTALGSTAGLGIYKCEVRPGANLQDAVTFRFAGPLGNDGGAIISEISPSAPNFPPDKAGYFRVVHTFCGRVLKLVPGTKKFILLEVFNPDTLIDPKAPPTVTVPCGYLFQGDECKTPGA